MKSKNWVSLLISVAISLGTGIAASLLTMDAMEQYNQMYRPPLSPPAWVFPVVWTILYILMGIAAYLIYRSNDEGKNVALRYYFAQLGANFIWTQIFFGLNAYLLSFAWLLLLWYLIFLTIKEFAKIDKTAAKLLWPYLIWVTFAGYLNLAIALYYFG